MTNISKMNSGVACLTQSACQSRILFQEYVYSYYIHVHFIVYMCITHLHPFHLLCGGNRRGWCIHCTSHPDKMTQKCVCVCVCVCGCGCGCVGVCTYIWQRLKHQNERGGLKVTPETARCIQRNMCPHTTTELYMCPHNIVEGSPIHCVFTQLR